MDRLPFIGQVRIFSQHYSLIFNNVGCLLSKLYTNVVEFQNIRGFRKTSVLIEHDNAQHEIWFCLLPTFRLRSDEIKKISSHR